MQPYNDTLPKGEQVKAMFDNIAPAYDRLNHILSLGIDRSWRLRTVRELAAGNPSRILDIATGTGDLAIMTARRLSGSAVTGIDPSVGMLEVARRKITDKGLAEQITLQCGEAERLPMADSSFDAVTVAFGVRNFHDLGAGLAEMHRVLAEGGRLYVLEFSTPRNKLFGAVYNLYFLRILPWIGGLVSKDRKAYEYLPRSVYEFPTAERFTEMLRQAGFNHCRTRRFLSGVANLYTGTK